MDATDFDPPSHEEVRADLRAVRPATDVLGSGAHQGEDGAILLGALAAFEQPTTVAQGTKALARKLRLAPPNAHEAISHLVEGRFLEPV